MAVNVVLFRALRYIGYRKTECRTTEIYLYRVDRVGGQDAQALNASYACCYLY